jgi:citrate synthase
MEIAAAAKANGATFLGPNTLGALSPGKGVVGMIGGRADSARQWFKPGVPKGVGVISRSGGMASSTGYYLGQGGVRISTIVHIGGDAVIGIRLPDAALMFEQDPVTEAIVIFGEIGSSQEEELARLIVDGKITKPVIAYIGGKAAREGTRFSHAGAIIEGGRGTHAGKVKALREAGATVVDAFGELPDAVVQILKKMKGQSLMSEADKNAVWNTAITRVEPNKVAVRGYDIAELMGRISFGASVYLILTGELPSPAVARLMDAILVSSIDHGATPPSALAARSVASTGATLSASVAAGIMSINRHHGGAIEDCARQLRVIADRATRESISMDEAAARTLAVMREAGERMPGFGHRLHTKDPRTARLFELAREAGVDGVHIQAARAVEKAFAAAKKSLPINVDGAIGAILADLGMNPAAFNGIFMIARTPGFVAHVIEEQSRERPMRRIDPVNHGYDGPPARSLTTNPPSRDATADK